ncbi:prophage antirepressor [Candidatus Liberibacter solanacearum CLso-ZC1]|uniref:Prophage antirepressor n=1 Tax=Liberibacter solanacearum (strain CLso-ZC1) TaxID=658172 RepID=E4UC57_LIBSC|nr:phage repressor protein [Candidatus Liberibacter solanacearum]ADR51947.1 prophage antirepressor [Candidatus Liberibacter solanacearum CLso-ZC1]
MSSIIPFEFESNKIRTVVDKDNTILFVAKDIAEALGYKRPNDAVNEHCDGTVKHRPIVDSLGRKQKTRVIKEPDVYRLIVKSKLPSAQKFERWIFEEVLPTLRKTGSYSIKPPKPQVFITGGLLKELRLLTDNHGNLMRKAGIDENQILIASSRVMESVLGVNPANTLDIPTPNNSQYYTATALGEQLPVKLSGREINKRLVRLGFLLVEHEPSGKRRNILTTKGKELGGRVFDSGKKHSDGSIVQSIKWQENILDILKANH